MEHEVVPVTLPNKTKNTNTPPVIITKDEEYTSIKLDKVSTLSPAFGSKTEGTVTAANASKLSGIYMIVYM